MLNYNGLRSTEDYWNENRNSYEVRFANHAYEIKVETIGFTGRRLTCYMSADWSEDEFIIRYDPNYRLWAIGSRRTGKLKPCYLGCDDMKIIWDGFIFSTILRYVDLPADLLEFVKSAIRKDPNFKYYNDSVFDEKLI